MRRAKWNPCASVGPKSPSSACEAVETIRALRAGEVDALVVEGAAGHQVFTIQGADHAYRLMIEAMNEGAVTLSGDGLVLYCNERFAAMLRMPREHLVGQSLHQIVAPVDLPVCEALLKQALGGASRGELRLTAADGTSVPVCFSTTNLRLHKASGFCVIVTDLTEQRLIAEESKLAQSQLEESERRFREMAENIREVLYTSDLRSPGIAYISPAYEEVWGRPCESVYRDQLPSLESIHSEDRELVSNAFRALFAGEAQDFEYRIVRPDGSIRWVWDRGFPVRDETGAVIRIVGIAEDITERKHANEVLIRLAAIVESSNDAIISEGLDGKVVSWNKAAERIFGFAAHEVIGESISLLIPEDRSEEMQTIISRVARGESVEDFETVRIHKEGARLDISLTVSPMRDASGKITGISKIARDITERKRAEALDRERKSLEEAIRAMEQVLGVVGHELRTPLAGIRAMSEFLLSPEAPASKEHDSFLNAINDEVVRMADMVNDILEAARLSSGAARWNWGEFSLAQACQEALSTLRPLLDEARVAVSIAVQPPDFQMKGDHAAVRRLVLNLLSNAQKHTKDGEIRVLAEWVPQADENWVELRVEDTGEGMAPATAARLGEAFALNSGVVGGQFVKGTGLGLSICRGIVGAHDGSIHVESALGQGTAVTVRLRADLPGPVVPQQSVRITRRVRS